MDEVDNAGTITDEVGELHDELGLEDGDDGLALEPYDLLDDAVPLGLALVLHGRRRRRRGPPVAHPGVRVPHQRPGRPARRIEARPAGIGFGCSSRGAGAKDRVGQRRCAMRWRCDAAGGAGGGVAGSRLFAVAARGGASGLSCRWLIGS